MYIGWIWCFILVNGKWYLCDMGVVEVEVFFIVLVIDGKVVFGM